MNSKLHIDRCGAEVNMIKFTKAMNFIFVDFIDV